MTVCRYVCSVDVGITVCSDMCYKVLLLVASLVSGDRRCLLEGGGSTDTFFVREDSRVGEEIGRIRVVGKMSLAYSF